MRKIVRPVCPRPVKLKSDYKDPINKATLLDAAFGKCMYCESKISHIDFAHVEHIKPKAIYPSLKFEWANLGIACSKCNNAKSDKYCEQTPYINPYEEDPKNSFVAFGAMLWHRQGNERAEITIRDIALNRPALMEKRQTELSRFVKVIDACYRTNNENLKNEALKMLKEECEISKEYSFFIETFYNLHHF